ncbi:MAG: hypothetical protein U0136_15230 [Bdellovibrionota bacterium]
MAATFLALEPNFDPTAQTVRSLSLPRELWEIVENPAATVVGSVEELMSIAIAAARKSCLEGIDGKRGGPFGAVGAIPQRICVEGNELDFASWYASLTPEATLKQSLPLSSVKSWKLIAIGVNLVEVFDNAALHAEMVLGMQVSACTGRNWWKRFVLAVTTGAPCGMCESFFTWAAPRYVVGGAPLSGAVVAGLHEALTPAQIEALIRDPNARPADDEPWAGNLRARGVEVRCGVESQKVIDELYIPYVASGGTLYNSGPDDPTG